MDEDDWAESAAENESENYVLSARDAEVIHGAVQLLEKIARAPFTRPAELVSVASLLHVLSVAPRVSGAGSSARLTLRGPTRQYGDHKISHWWSIECADERIAISAGGYFFRPSTGGDSFTVLEWVAQGGEEAEYLDHLPWLGIVDDACPFPEEVDRLNLNEDGFMLEVEDDANLLLDEMRAFEGEEREPSDMASETVNDALTAADAQLATLANKAGGDPPRYWQGDAGSCDVCHGSPGRFAVDGRLRGTLMFAWLCARCFLARGEGIGWGIGQLYQRLTDGRWLMAGGFPPDETA
jgi:hypothetical protein